MRKQFESLGYLALAGAAALAVATSLMRKQDSYRAPQAVQEEQALPAPEETAGVSPASMPLRDAVGSKFMVPAYPGSKLPTLSAADSGLLGEPQSPKNLKK